MKTTIITISLIVTILSILAFRQADFTIRPTTKQKIGTFYVSGKNYSSDELRFWADINFTEGYRIITTTATDNVVIIVMEK